MSFGFLGIQFGWALQMANMSAIYEYLGASADQIPMLWLAAPLTGLIVQPIIGHMSDHTWSPRFGRRRPYFLVGAILASLALLVMPNAGTLWMAAGLLWILDASINVSMEPFRAFVADLLPQRERTRGFAMQSIFIGLGAVLASAMPWMLTNWFGVGASTPGTIPTTVRFSFYIGAAAFMGAVLYTILTTPEHPPRDLAEFARKKAESKGIATATREIVAAIRAMPETMRQLAVVQICTWLGLFCMWLYFPVAVARNVFGAPDANSPLYQQGVEWAGVCFGAYSVVCFAFSFFLPSLARTLGRKGTHATCLTIGAAGLLSVVGDLEPDPALAVDGWGGDRLGEHPLDAVLDAGRLAAGGKDRGVHGDLQLLHRHPRDRGVVRLRVGDEPPAGQQPHGGGGLRRGVHAPRGAAGAAGEGPRGRRATLSVPRPAVVLASIALPNGGARRAGACGFEGRAAQLVGEFLGQSGAGDGARHEPRRRALRLRAPGLRQRPGERARELCLRRRDHPARCRDRHGAAYAAHRERFGERPLHRHAAPQRHGRYQGFGTEDVLYLLMPDRFAMATRATTIPPSPKGSSTGARGATTTAATWPACARASPTSSR